MITINNYAKFEFNYMGQFISNDEWIHPEFTIPTYEIIYVIKGVVYIEEDGVQYELHENDVLCLKPNLCHKGYKASKDVSFFWLHFTADNYDEIGIYQAHTEDKSHANLFKELNHLATVSGYQTLIETKILSFLFELKNDLTKRSKLFFDACEFINANIEKNLSVVDVSDEFFYSADHLSKVFKKCSGLTLKEYIDNARNNAVKNLLLSTYMTISEIAETLNFESANALNKFFKYNNKISPSSYRNNYYASYINRK